MDPAIPPPEHPWWRERAIAVSACLLVFPIVALAGAFRSENADDRPRFDQASAAVDSSPVHSGH